MAYPTVTQHSKIYPHTSLMAAPYFCDATGVLDCAAKIEQIKANQGNLGAIFVPRGTFLVNTNLTIPIGMSLEFAEGATISIGAGVTLTISGPILSPPGQYCFSGTGSLSPGSTYSASVSERVFPPGVWSITTNITIPSNITVRMLPGAYFTIATAKTLTINGPIIGNRERLFNCIGTGSVLFGDNIREVYLEYFDGKPDNGTTDNGPAFARAIAAMGSTGRPLILSSGVYEFATEPWDGTTKPVNGFTIQGAGSIDVTTATDGVGTLLKYTGTSTLFKLYTSTGTTEEGYWQFKDLTVQCTDTGSAFEFNDTTLDMGVAGSPCFLKGVGFHNVNLIGNGGDWGIAGLGMFNFYIDPNCTIKNFKYACWLKDSDGSHLYYREHGNTQGIRITRGSVYYSNGNFIGVWFNPGTQYSGEDFYRIYDTGGFKTIIEARQLEVGDATESPFYINSLNTTIKNTFLSVITDCANAGVIGADATAMRFINCAGAPVDTSKKITINAPTSYSSNTSDVGDCSIYYQSCATEFENLFPSNPRVVPEVKLLSGQGTAGGVSTGNGEVWGLPAYMGLGAAQPAFRIDPFRRFYGSSGYGVATWEVDSTTTTGWRLSLDIFSGPSEHMLSKSFIVGQDVGLTDVLRIVLKYAASGTPTGGDAVLQIYNITQDTYILNTPVTTATTSYQVWDATTSLSGSVVADDVIEVRVSSTLTDDSGSLYLYIDYLDIVPAAQPQLTASFFYPLIAEPDNKRIGMMVLADRTNWDPCSVGSGGAYFAWYNGTAWKRIDLQ